MLSGPIGENRHGYFLRSKESGLFVHGICSISCVLYCRPFTHAMYFGLSRTLAESWAKILGEMEAQEFVVVDGLCNQ